MHINAIFSFNIDIIFQNHSFVNSFYTKFIIFIQEYVIISSINATRITIMFYTIDKKHDNKTVKEYALGYLKLSSNMLTKLKQINTGIMLNGERVTVRAVLHTGDRLELAVEYEPKTSGIIFPIEIPLDIIFEDEYYIALNKPPHMPTHPSHDHYGDTLANGLAYRYYKENKPFVFRAVNRLDKNTSGIVIFAKSSLAASEFSKLQQNKLVVKEYLALVDGITDAGGFIEGYIRRTDKSIILRQFSKEMMYDNDAWSLTEYQKLAMGDNASLLKIILHTGRTHQIRVHMQSIGHSIIGDDLYGVEDVNYERHMLHAYKMSFVHPFTKKQILFSSKIPGDFLEALTKKGIQYGHEN